MRRFAVAMLMFMNMLMSMIVREMHIELGSSDGAPFLA